MLRTGIDPKFFIDRTQFNVVFFLCYFEDIKGILVEENGIEATEEEFDKLPYAEPLTPEEIRWFYKDGVHKRWIQFCGYDSLRIENAWRIKQAAKEHENIDNSLTTETVVVRGGMYDVELDNMRCVSIYWPGI